MMKPLASMLAAAFLAAATTASGADRVCSGEAKGAGKSRARVGYVMDEAGAVASRQADWTPKSIRDADLPMLTIGYRVTDAGLGEANSVGVLAMLSAERTPKSKTAEIVLTLDDGSVWRRPWGMFAQLRQQVGKPAPGGGKPAGFFGMIPISYGGDATNPAYNTLLLDHLAGARQVVVTVVGDASETFADNTFDLSDKAGREALYAEAKALADAAAKSPATCPARPS